MNRVKRETKILQTVSNIENVIKLYDVVHDQGSQTISLVFEYFSLVDFHKIFLKLNDVQIKLYLFELLQVFFIEFVIKNFKSSDFGSSAFIWHHA